MFYLGTHRPGWLWKPTPRLFISRRQLEMRSIARLTPGLGRWGLDSGGFTELKMHGRWSMTAKQYVAAVRPYVERIGGCDFVAPQDWMCEPEMLAKTGKTVSEHQKLTVENFVELRDLAPDLPIAPALQGYEDPDTYLACAQMYRDAGVDLATEPVVGVGSVCRLQHTDTIERVFAELVPLGLAMHGFGVKTQGLLRYGQHLASADSLAWSFRARRSEPLPGCTHMNCANCLKYALKWHGELMGRFDQRQLEDVAA